MKRTLAVMMSMMLAISVIAAQNPNSTTSTGTESSQKKAPAKKAAPSAVTAADVQSLKDAIAAQQQQIKALSDLVTSREQKIEQLELKLDQNQAAIAQAKKKADAAVEETAAEQDTVDALQNDVATLKNVNFTVPTPHLQNAVFALEEPAQATENDQQVYNKDMEGPLTIHFKGINITPGGFAEAAFVRRSRALGADLTTPFNNLTMPGASQSQLSEFFGSARQSRPTVYVAGKVGNVMLSSYLSGDFLSAGVTSTATQTNSYTFRLRQVWGQARFDNGWSFLGGQMWSLITENKASIAPSDDTGKTNDARPMTIDPQYNVGFTFARQYGLRLTKQFGNTVAFAVAMENAQATATTHENANNYLLLQAGTNNSYNSTATYGFNPSPDLIAKIAFDPGFGHYEIFGLYDRFKDRVFPCEEGFTSNPVCVAGGVTSTSAFGAYNASKNGGGFGATARWTFADKHIVFGLKGFGGSGIGRYGAAQLADASINANGTVHLVKDLQGLATLEWHGKRLDIYSYLGAEYAARTWSIDTLKDPGTNVEVGYGAPGFNNSGCYTEALPTTGTLTGSTPVAASPAGCIGDTRNIVEGTIGFWYRFYQGPRGRFQFGTQYSYVNRNTWSGNFNGTTAGIQPNGLDGMVFTSFRYYLP
jgi:hypothetical protein